MTLTEIYLAAVAHGAPVIGLVSYRNSQTGQSVLERYEVSPNGTARKVGNK